MPVSTDEVLPFAEIRAQTERILASRSFVHAERLSRFLRFAVDRALEGQAASLKEYSIGVAVFDRSGAYDPRNDPIVRVEAGRLRTRLKGFYQTEGRNDPVVIDFHKGSYIPQFHRRQASPNRRQWRAVLLAAAVAAFAAAAFWAARPPGHAATSGGPALAREFAPIWEPFFAAGRQNFVVFGSPLFFASPRLNVFLRRGDLNDPTGLPADPNFQALQERFGPLSGPRYDYAEMGETLALQRLTAFFGRLGGSLTALPAHQAAWDSLKDGNIILIGTPRMNPLMRRLLDQHDFRWDSDHNIRNLHPQPGEQATYSTSSHRDAITFAVIGSFPGLRPDREILSLTAHSGPGTLAAVDQVTRPEAIRSLTERLPRGERKHYQFLLRVVVDNNAPVQSEYLAHHVR